ncbi:MAG TPA: NmrA family NAD(P)-binding protein [Terracidiphilus sp.]|jgi:uncharacterized protein YbjT (DUF2867 family)|nr:NmrA family NAD(P)-binding protein [Terracidiphilus sp.]
MFAVTGITGNVGSVVAQALLSAGQSVRAVVRDAAKAAEWTARGCTLAVADIYDSASLATAFKGANAVFIMVPPVFDPGIDFPEARAIAASLRAALDAARPARAVYLSTIGAQAAEQNLLSQHTLIEKALRDQPVPITFLRPGWFMENCLWDVAPARESGVIHSFLQPLDQPYPMVATADIGKLAAALMQESWTGSRVVELEGPRRISPNEIAATFARLLGKPVRMQVVPRGEWEPLFRMQGMKNPEPRARMVDGFNEGWIAFEFPSAVRIGATDIEEVLKTLLAR